EINVEDMIKEEDMVVLVSKLGYIKRIAASQYKSQGRGGKGSFSANLVEDDYISQIFIASTHDNIMFITNEGKAYWIKAHEIPEASKTSRGAHIKSLLSVSADEEITTIVAVKEFSETQYVLMATSNGVVKKTALSDFSNAKAKGIIAIKLDEGDKLICAILTQGKDDVFLISRRGKALRISEEDVRAMGRASRGTKGMKLAEGDEISAAVRVEKDKGIMLVTEKGYGKRITVDDFKPHGRGTGGQRCYGNTEERGEIIGALSVAENDEVLCITSQGKTLRVAVNTIKEQGAGSSGVTLVKIESPDYLVGVDRVAEEDEEAEGTAEIKNSEDSE
ncbi:MAG: DNA gyrase C-terminal beta-propeller domain-containing protein, partial [Treponema sp.]